MIASVLLSLCCVCGQEVDLQEKYDKYDRYIELMQELEEMRQDLEDMEILLGYMHYRVNTMECKHYETFKGDRVVHERHNPKECYV